VADYSEFPTTPTAWQEQQWQMVAPLAIEDQPQPQPRRRRVDLLALVPGLFFLLLAISTMAGADLSLGLFDGGLMWLVLIGAGVALLVKELRKARNRA
jgi:hypothetical protein